MNSSDFVSGFWLEQKIEPVFPNVRLIACLFDSPSSLLSEKAFKKRENVKMKLKNLHAYMM